MPFEHLRAPFQLASFKIPNRIVMPPMVVWKAAEDGAVTPAILEHYRDSLGPGMMIVEATVVSAEGRLARQQLGIFEDRHVEGLARIAAIIHAAGSVASIQLHHAGRNTNLENTFGLPLVAPSAVAAKGHRVRGSSPKTASSASWSALPRQHAAPRMRVSTPWKSTVPTGTSRASSCRPSRTNGKIDGAAASRTGRGSCARLPAACVQRSDPGCSYRVGSVQRNPIRAVSASTKAPRWRSGWRRTACRSSTFPPESAARRSSRPRGSPWSDRLLLGAAVRKAVGIPVIGLGGIRTPDQAERALAEGLVDLVGVGRAMLADPQWAAKTLAGRQDEIYLCRQCRVCHHFRHAERCPARKEAELAAGLT